MPPRREPYRRAALVPGVHASGERTNTMATQSKKSPAATTPDAAPGLSALLYQLLETEMGGVQVYRTALQCALHPELREEWTRYLAQTERHVVIARSVVAAAGLDPDAETPARIVCRHQGDALVMAMVEALSTGTPEEAQLTAAECVVKAETKDHLNWELVGLLAKKTTGPLADALRVAHEEVEVEEDHHLYHTQGWTRELWAHSLGLPAVLPPPEETMQVESAVGAARAKRMRDQTPPSTH
jgi:hypothetical protein